MRIFALPQGDPVSLKGAEPDLQNAKGLSVQKTTLVIAGVALMGLGACGGSGGAVSSQFAGSEAPSGIEDLIGLTFPVRVASLGYENGTVTTVTRDTWSLRYTSSTTAVLSSAYGTFFLSDDGGMLVGESGGFEVQVTNPNGGDYVALFLISVGDADAMTGSTSAAFFGLETTVAGVDALVENNATAMYEGGSLLLVEYGDDLSSIEQIDGTADLSVDFGTGEVSGALLETPTSTISLVNGVVSGNGFAGTMAVGGDLGIVMSIDTSDVDGLFFGGAAEELAGTFEGTGTYANEPATFGGAFGAISTP